MRKIISRLLILCLLLTGCTRKEAVEPVFTPTAEPVVVQGLYDRGSNLEISSSGAVQVFPLGSRTGKGLLPLEGGLLLFSGGEQTTLTWLTGDTLIPASTITLDFSLEPEDCAIHDGTFSYYDPAEKSTVLMDTSFQKLHTIPAPPGLIGKPLLSPDGNILYYCTASTVQAWDLHTNIHRTLRQTNQPYQTAYALYCGGSVLRCQMGSQSIFLSTATGELLYQEDTALKLATPEDGYIAASWETNLWSLVFQQEGRILSLTPRTLSAEYFLMAETGAVVTAASTGEVVTLDHYDLASGKRTATQMLRATEAPAFIEKDGAIYGLVSLPEYEGSAIIRWDVSRIPLSDPKRYTGPHFTANNPDREGLAQCQAYASQIGDRYGLEILIWEDAAALAPAGISVKPEHRVNILRRELELLDHRLSQFPDGFLQTTAANFGALKIGLVSQISGSIRPGSLQFFSGTDACILLTAGDTAQASLYNQLFHVIQTHILSHSSALDQWQTLNPQGFQYDYDYTSNAIRNSGMYLTEKNRSFIDTFSMSYPTEDRAKIFEHAMLPNQDHLFQTKAMQKKLRSICQGIRDAYHLTAEAPYLWEQYLS